MTSRDQAIATAAQILTNARAERDALTPEQAAQAALIPGESLDAKIAAIRNMRAQAQAENRRPLRRSA